MLVCGTIESAETEGARSSIKAKKISYIVEESKEQAQKKKTAKEQRNN
jgi:hypothetical protein